MVQTETEQEDSQGEWHLGTTFITAPKLEDEAMYIYYEGEKHYAPAFKATENELADLLYLMI